MLSLDNFFKPEDIIKLLCKYRIKEAKKRHKIHLINDVSKFPATLTKFKKSQEKEIPEINDLFPNRRSWIRLSEEERKRYKNSNDLNVECLRRTILSTHIRVKKREVLAPSWYLNLNNYIQNIRHDALLNKEYSISAPTVIAEIKEIKGNITECRPLALYSFKDRIIIGLTSKYLTQIFDDFLIHECCFAFRSPNNKIIPTHHDTIKEVLKFRNSHKSKKIWIAECDLKKFFDCVNHNKIEEVYNSFVRKVEFSGKAFDRRADKVFASYLQSYCFNKDVLSLNNNQDYFKEQFILNGEFKWPLEGLQEQFYPNLDIKKDIRIGVPQGGAISCLIANLILHEVDENVSNYSKGIKYMRFCDDMIILSTSKEECIEALEIYKTQVKKFLLLIHEPIDVSIYNRDFWSEKSKNPYLWDKRSLHEMNVPWLSFVGYQIRYDGIVRIRKKSIKKETEKQKEQANVVLKSINASDKKNIDKNSRKSLKQQVNALESRLIAMSVGRITFRNSNSYLPSYCWTAGFKEVNNNFVLKSQLQYLDKSREYHLYKFKKQLASLNVDVHKPDKEYNGQYKGAPFSYQGFIKTNDRIK